MSKTVEIAVMGLGSVGKSALVLKYVCDVWSEVHDATIEDTYRKETEIDGQSVCLEILDTAGQEEFKSMQDSWVQKGEGFILVYDISNESTFEGLQHFIDKIERTSTNLPIIIVGNKSDLEDQRTISRATAEKWAKQKNAAYIETSARTGANVTGVFETIYKEINTNKPYPKKRTKRFCTVL